MAILGHLAVPSERNCMEQDPIQWTLRGRSVHFLSLGTCTGYQEEAACCGPGIERNVILQYFSSSLILYSLCSVHNPAALFHSRGAVVCED